MALVLVTFLCVVGLLGITGVAIIVVVSKVLELVRQHGETRHDEFKDTLETVSKVMQETVTSAIAETSSVWLKTMVGEPGVSVPQPAPTPENDLLHPNWMQWADGDEDSTIPDVGDSVFFQRPMDTDNRAEMLQEGEGIIPGVPLPDMTGENWSGK